MTGHLKAVVAMATVPLLVALVTGCGGGSPAGGQTGTSGTATHTTSASNTNGGTVKLANGSMSCTIDGSAWHARVISIATYTNGTLSVSGADGSTPPHALAFAVIASGPGTHNIEPSIADTSANAVLTISGSLWQAVPLVRGSGTITIDTLTASGASGTFSFSMEAVPGSSATGTKTVTNGVFNVTFTK